MQTKIWNQTPTFVYDYILVINVKSAWKKSEFVQHSSVPYFQFHPLSDVTVDLLEGGFPNPLRCGLKGGYLHMKMTYFQAASKWVREFPLTWLRNLTLRNVNEVIWSFFWRHFQTFFLSYLDIIKTNPMDIQSLAFC